MIVGGLSMGICMCLLATLGYTYGTTAADGTTTIPSKLVGYICITSIYIYVISFAYSWGPVCWLLPTEIFPLSQRAKGVSITTGANFCFNFLVGLFTPYALQEIHFGLFFVFSCCLFCLVLYVYRELPETKGVQLELIAQLFEPDTDWRAQREIFAEEGSPTSKRRKCEQMPRSSSYDDLLSASMVTPGTNKRKLPKFSDHSEEALLNP